MQNEELKKKLERFIIAQVEDEKADNTIRKYRCDIEMMLEWLNDRELTKVELIDYKKHLLSQCYSEATVNGKITSINKFLEFCKLKKLKLKNVRIQRKVDLDKVISVEDYLRLTRWANKIGDRETYMIMQTLSNTGIRIAELKFFKIEDLKKKIKVTNKGKTRYVPIRDNLRRELKEYCTDTGIENGVIFRNKKTLKPLNESTVWRRLKKIAGMAKVNKERVYPHSFRHFFAINFLKSGGTVFDLADILGHTSLEVTRIYGSSSTLEKKRAIDGMEYHRRKK